MRLGIDVGRLRLGVLGQELTLAIGELARHLDLDLDVEVAHAVARHGGERMTEAMGVQLFGSFVNGYVANTDPRLVPAVNVAYGIGSQSLVVLPHSRAQESEADHIGLIYMAEAGYDPRTAVAFWQRFADFEKQQGGSTPAFLRTHPTDAKRIQQLQVWMPEALAQYHPAGK